MGNMLRLKGLIHSPWATRWEYEIPCFLCLWDSRAKQDHWIKREWRSREVFILGEKNIKNIPLVNREKILLPPLHIVVVVVIV